MAVRYSNPPEGDAAVKVCDLFFFCCCKDVMFPKQLSIVPLTMLFSFLFARCLSEVSAKLLTCN